VRRVLGDRASEVFMRVRARLFLSAVIALGFSSPAFAQGRGGQQMPKLPSPEEMEKKIGEFLDKCPTTSAELEGMCKLTYKEIPTSPDEIGKLIGEEYKNQIPKGVDIDAAMKQFQPQIQEALNKYLTEPKDWKFEALQDLKWKSKKIPQGVYKVTIQTDGENLNDLILVPNTDAKAGDKPKKGDASKPIPAHFKAVKKQDQPFDKLNFEFKSVPDKKKPDAVQFELWSKFFRTEAKTTDVFKPQADAPKKDTPKKDDPKPADDSSKKDDSKKDDSKKDDGKGSGGDMGGGN
jgi:hypothetical protein